MRLLAGLQMELVTEFLMQNPDVLIAIPHMPYALRWVPRRAPSLHLPDSARPEFGTTGPSVLFLCQGLCVHERLPLAVKFHSSLNVDTPLSTTGRYLKFLWGPLGIKSTRFILPNTGRW